MASYLPENGIGLCSACNVIGYLKAVAMYSPGCNVMVCVLLGGDVLDSGQRDNA